MEPTESGRTPVVLIEGRHLLEVNQRISKPESVSRMLFSLPKLREAGL